ncbi:DMT family transporter [Afifella aestuarii]|uniref:DMT family transporter n=1 Tax=Afifella aestuarii TaxID=1909496 RepID=UPI000FE34857|nr:DMT family transporter [Afifella aestuarii]
MTVRTSRKQPATADNLTAAAAVILMTDLALSLGDALIKLTSGTIAVWQLFLLRSLMALPLLVPAVLASSGATLRPRALAWTTLRSLMLVLMWLAYYAALPHLQLSVAAVSYYTLPVFITLFSALFVGERVGPIGWMAVALGLAGVLLILRPDAAAFNAYALLPLLSAVLYALAMILTRTKCREEHPLTLSLALNLAFVVVGLGGVGIFQERGGEGGYLTTGWLPLGAAEIGTLVLLSAAMIIGSLGAAFSYQRAPSNVIGTLDFSYVGFAAIWGLLLFQEIPSLITLGGMALIVGAGILALRR